MLKTCADNTCSTNHIHSLAVGQEAVQSRWNPDVYVTALICHSPAFMFLLPTGVLLIHPTHLTLHPKHDPSIKYSSTSRCSRFALQIYTFSPPQDCWQQVINMMNIDRPHWSKGHMIDV